MKKQKLHGNFALKNVQKFFPKVSKVSDAEEDMEIEVTDRDERTAAKKDHTQCALAVACKRSQHADGVLISVHAAYVIKGDEATRFSLPESAKREVVSFDRGAKFSPGEYVLKKPSKSQRLGARTERNTHATTRPHKAKRRKPHVTDGIRTVLGSKLAA